MHDLDAAWWSIDPGGDTGTPYRESRFVIDPSPGLTHAASRVSLQNLTWQTRTAG